MFLHKMGWIFQQVLYPELTWSRYTQEKKIYLTFDDGPIPELTEWVLDQLSEFDAKATFFCVGDNVRKHPEIFQKLLDGGHSIGNHTYNHLNGWKTEDERYFQNIEQCSERLGSHSVLDGRQSKPLFRPPYGKIKKSQIRKLTPHFEVIMWDVLSGDFSPNLSPEKCLKKSIQYTQPGSIVVFHDNIKARKNIHFALPRYLKFFADQGFQFEGLGSKVSS